MNCKALHLLVVGLRYLLPQENHDHKSSEYLIPSYHAHNVIIVFFHITAAVKRHYENARRNHKENQDGMESYVEEQAKRRRYRSRRHRVIDMFECSGTLQNTCF